MTAQAQTFDTPLLQLRAAVRPDTVNIDDRTVEITWTTGAKGRRWSWDVGSYMEELEVSDSAVRLDRLNNGAPFLNTHNSWELEDVIGVVEKAWIEGGEGRALIRFSQRDDVEPIFRDVRDGILRNISVGYSVHRYEIIEGPDDKLPTYRAVDWEPMELSLVPIGFDDGGKVRSATEQADYKGPRFSTVFESREAAAPTEQPAVSAKTQEETQMTEEQIRAAEEAARREAAEAERKRGQAIRLMARKVGLGEDFADELIERGVTPEQASAAMIDKLAERQQQSQPDTRSAQPTPSGTVDLSVLRAKRSAMENALQHRCNPAIQLVDAAREFRGMRLLDLARECIGDVGGNSRGLSAREIATAALGCSSEAYRAARACTPPATSHCCWAAP